MPNNTIEQLTHILSRHKLAKMLPDGNKKAIASFSGTAIELRAILYRSAWDIAHKYSSQAAN